MGEDGAVTGVSVRNVVRGDNKIILVSGCFVAIGTVPNTEFLDGR